MRPILRMLAAAGALLAVAGCTQIGAAEPAPAPFGPGYYGPGPGMMRGYGPGMMGPGYGMMGPGSGYGMGPGMMGPGMMGPGMMGGWGGLPSGLTAEQRSRIAEIQREQRARQWPLMQQMHELMWSEAASESGTLDEQAQRRDYDRLAGLHKQMFENMLESRKRIEAVLTPQQREELRRNWRAAR